jgi:bis(5'-nucleosyl)-tetraphosphatase (symmetrical)
MRFCDKQGHLSLHYKGTVEKAPCDLYPWFLVPHRHEIPADLVFGHWAALQGKSPHPHIHALDTGCLWGGALTALRLQDKQRFSVPA